MSEKQAAVLAASWGYDVYVELDVSQEDWARIVAGDKVTIQGEGYDYEGETFLDFWDFSGGIDGQLEVRYGSEEEGDFSGQGFIGSIRESLKSITKPVLTQLKPG
jgi:hypothetical protein